MFSFDDEHEHVIWLEAGYMCDGCGCKYRHRFKLPVMADDPEEAMGRARRTVLRKGLRDVPCPECGRVTAPVLRSRHPAMAAAMAAAAIGLCLVVLLAWKTHTLKITAGAIAVGGTSAYAFVYSMWLLFSRNAPSAKRRLKACELIERKLIRSVQPGEVAPRTPPIGGWREVAVVMAVPWVAVFIFAVVGLGTSSISDAYNPDVIPGFVAPGDEVHYQFPERLTTVKGLWRGQPRFNSRIEPASTRPAPITGEGRFARWPEDFVLRRGEERVTVYPDVRFRVPFQPELAGNRIEMTIRMEVTYPQSQGPAPGGGLVIEEKLIDLESQVLLRVASTDEVNRLQAAWWVGAILGVVCLAVPPLVLTIRSWRVRNANYILDLQPSQSPKND